MQKMLGLQQPGHGKRVEISHAVVEGPDALGVEAQVTDAKRVEHRRYTGGRALRIVRDHRGTRWPSGVAARLDLPLEIIRVQVNEPCNQIISVKVNSSWCAHAPINDLPNAVIADHNRSIAYAGREHQFAIGQDRLGHAASCRAGTANRRSATASRAVMSCMMARTAIPER